MNPNLHHSTSLSSRPPTVRPNRTYIAAIAIMLTGWTCTATASTYQAEAAKTNPVQSKTAKTDSAVIAAEMAELKTIAKQWAAQPQRMLTLRPSWSDVRKLTGQHEDAAKIARSLCSQQFGVYQGIGAEGLKIDPALSQIAVGQLKVTNYLGNEAIKRLGNVRLYRIKFSDPKSKTPAAGYSAFAKIDGRWVFFINPWDDLEKVNPDSLGSVDLWWSLLGNKRYQDAYELSAPVLSEVMTFEQFKSHAVDLQLDELESVNWRVNSRERRNSEQTFIKEGKATFNDGSEGELIIHSVWLEGEGFLPFRVSLKRLFGATDAFAFVPKMEKTKAVARQAVLQLAKAIEKNDYKDMHESALSYNLKSNTTPEILANAFGRFADDDLSFLDSAKIAFFRRPVLDNKNKYLDLAGSFRNPEKGKVLTFTMSIEESGKKWLLNAINFYPVRDYDPQVKVPQLSKTEALKLAEKTTRAFCDGMIGDGFSKLVDQMTPMAKKDLPAEKLSNSFRSLDRFFKTGAPLHDVESLKIKLRTSPAVDQDYLEVKVAITAAEGDESLGGTIEYIYLDGRWQVLRVNFYR